ncbi:MAG: phage tail tip lysozyme [Lachnospiraceae bacterium]|nr:phage tail tip lysozyme [Lachnospiraceae bacterium]
MSKANIYNRLMDAIGNPYGVCGLMGNIQAESGMVSTNAQNSCMERLGMTDASYTAAVDNGTYTTFATDRIGYGLCQWTSSGRKAGLLDYAKLTCKSIGDEDMQIEWLIYELSTSYKNVMKVLQSATSVKEASDIVVTKFERPANQSASNLAKRQAKGEALYRELVKNEKEEEKYKMIKPVDYKQTDARWGSNRYAVDGESSTIKSAGCGPTAMADVLAAIVSEYIDPLTCAAWARQHGYKVYKSGTSYSYPVAQAAEYGVKVRRLNTSNVYGKPQAAVHNQALEELRNGNWIIACMGKGLWTSSGHYIVAYGVDGGMVYINDPASGRADRACNKWQTFISQVKYYWVVEVPDSIKKYGFVKGGAYRYADFVREVQMCIKAGIDGKAGTQTLSRTVTVSKVRNRKHNVVLPLQKALKKRGMYLSGLDRIAGSGFKAAVDAYQSSVLKYRNPDGEITAKGKMWRSLLGM